MVLSSAINEKSELISKRFHHGVIDCHLKSCVFAEVAGLCKEDGRSPRKLNSVWQPVLYFYQKRSIAIYPE